MIRCGILAGVSSDLQARDDKASISDQLATCRRVIAQLGGTETGCYVMDGYSRTGYDSLADAMRDIPPLNEAIEAAMAGEYDVLVMDNFDRLGDLGQLVGVRFKKYKRQLYSARQSGRVHDPATYDPYSDESADIAMHVEGIIQRYRLNKIRRGLTLGINRRVESGKYSTRYPYGYRRNRETEELNLVASVATLLIRIKDAFLEGVPLRGLAAIAQDSGVSAPASARWHPHTIQRILTNPFYAGKVFYRRHKTAGYGKSPTSGKRWAAMKPNPAFKEEDLHEGKHPALWTWEEHRRIVEEMEARYRRQPRHDIRNFSGLMVCTVCGKPVNFRGRKYRCRTAPDHLGLKESDANRLIAQVLADSLSQFQESPKPRRVADPTREAVKEVQARIVTIQSHVEAESGMYTAEEAVARIQALRKQIEVIEKQAEDRQRETARRQRVSERQVLLSKLRLLPHFFVQENSVVVNRLLREVLAAIRITPERAIEIIWR